MYANICVCMYVCMYVCMCVCVCVCVCTYVCMHVSMHTCLYVCMHTQTHTILNTNSHTSSISWAAASLRLAVRLVSLLSLAKGASCLFVCLFALPVDLPKAIAAISAQTLSASFPRFRYTSREVLIIIEAARSRCWTWKVRCPAQKP